MLRRDLSAVEGVTAVPSSVGAFGSLTSHSSTDARVVGLRLPDGVSPLPASGCTAEMAAIAAFAYYCLSGAELAAGLDLTAEAAEVEALLDFCSANPLMRYCPNLSSACAGAPICGSGTLDIPQGGRAQWGNGDPCTGDGWYGVTCDAARERITEMCALRLRCLPVFVRRC